MKNIKKNELKREMLLAGEGFCKRMSMKELYAESPVWQYVGRLGVLLTRNWPTDKNGYKYWNPSYDLKRIRYQCIRVLYCKDEKTFEELFDGFSTAALMVLEFGSLPTEYLNIFLSWVALKFVKNPSCFVRRYTRVLRNLFFSINPFMVQYFIDTMGYEEYHQTLIKRGKKITPDEELQISSIYNWLYKNMEIHEPLIRKYREQDIYLKISPTIESPRNMYGSWWKQTKNFNLIRIAELLTLWEKDSDKAVIVNYIKEDYKRWNIDENDERKIKNEFIDKLLKSLKKDNCIHLLCHLQEENMKNIIKIENLTDENERTKKYYEEEKKQKQEQALIDKRTIVYNNFKHCDIGSICEDHSKHIYINNKNCSELADGAIHYDHHKGYTLYVSSKTDLVALIREIMKDEVGNAMKVTKEVKENNFNISKDLEIPESVKVCFRIANDYVREQVKTIVNDFYLGEHVNLAMIEVALFDHGQLLKRNEHTAFVRALMDWGLLPEGIDIAKTASGMASKLRKPFPTEGYKQWDKYYINERNLCTNIGNRLDASMKYIR